MRICISCRQTYNREDLIKITNDQHKGITFYEGIGRSAYICKKKKCYTDSKIKKKLQKALKTVFEPNFFDIFKNEIENYN